MKVVQITSNQIINEDISRVLWKNENILRMISKKNILITGANGMLPSYLVYLFVAANLQLNL
jgi:FlaA1/EpsC-like NDP-sugar epimerase